MTIDNSSESNSHSFNPESGSECSSEAADGAASGKSAQAAPGAPAEAPASEASSAVDSSGSLACDTAAPTQSSAADLGADPNAAKAAAREELEKLISENQNDPNLWILLAKVEHKAGNLPMAVRHLQRALVLSPGQPEAVALLTSLGANAAGPSTAPKAPEGPIPAKVLWLISPEKDGQADPVLAPLSQSLEVSRIVSLNTDVYVKALSRGTDPVILEGTGETIKRLLAAPGLFSGRRVLWRLNRDEILNEAWLDYDFSAVNDILLESIFLRDLMIGRLKALQKNLTSGSRLHSVGRCVDFARLKKLPPANEDRVAIAAPGPHGPWSGLTEVLEAFWIINEIHPQTELHLTGPFAGPAWEAALAYNLHGKLLADKVFIIRGQSPLETFLADKAYYLACPLVAGGPGLQEALFLGLKPLLKDAPGLNEFVSGKTVWRNQAELLALFEQPAPASEIGPALERRFGPLVCAKNLVTVLRQS
ncbi:MAG: hypothetical protein LBT47_12000 [Deltaproteobacteria bacterium]|nr:hypothetical protein [Deltaproteobacteria bacterium]